MKMRKNKGKIHPSPSSSSSSLSTPPSNSLPNQNALSVLALLPAAILALISVLSAEDKEVLAYMVTRSMNSVNPSHSSSAEEKNKKSSNGKKLLGSSSSSSSGGVVHKAPFFDCECFDCYTSYWFRWDSSPDKELIHKAIEEFEEFLFNQEQVKRSSSSGKGKRRERIGRRGREKAKEEETEEVLEEGFDVGVVGNEAEIEAAVEVEVEEVAVVEVGREAAAAAAVVDNYNKGLVRKVLPDVVGLFNSRLWGLWSPNV